MCFPISIAIEYFFFNTPIWIYTVAFAFWLIALTLLIMQKRKLAWPFLQISLIYSVNVFIGYLLAMVCQHTFSEIDSLTSMFLVYFLAIVPFLWLLAELSANRLQNYLALLEIGRFRKSTRVSLQKSYLPLKKLLILCWKFLRKVTLVVIICLIVAIGIAFLRGPWDRSQRTIHAFTPDRNFIFMTFGSWNREFKAAGGWSLDFSPDGNLIAAGGANGVIKIWRVNGRLLSELTGHSDGNRVFSKVLSLSFSPDSNLLVSGGGDNTVRLWRTDGSLINTFSGYENAVHSVDFSPDGSLIAGSGGKIIKIWDTDGNLINSFSRKKPASSAIFSRDGTLLVTDSYEAIELLRVSDGTLVSTFNDSDSGSGFQSIAFSSTENLIAASSLDKTIKLWQLDGKLIHTFSGHSGIVESIAFNPEGRLLAFGNRDGTIQLWTVDGVLIDTLVGHRSIIRSIVFSPDSGLLASLDTQGFIKLWKIKKAK